MPIIAFLQLWFLSAIIFGDETMTGLWMLGKPTFLFLKIVSEHTLKDTNFSLKRRIIIDFLSWTWVSFLKLVIRWKFDWCTWVHIFPKIIGVMAFVYIINATYLKSMYTKTPWLRTIILFEFQHMKALNYIIQVNALVGIDGHSPLAAWLLTDLPEATAVLTLGVIENLYKSGKLVLQPLIRNLKIYVLLVNSVTLIYFRSTQSEGVEDLIMSQALSTKIHRIVVYAILMTGNASLLQTCYGETNVVTVLTSMLQKFMKILKTPIHFISKKSKSKRRKSILQKSVSNLSTSDSSSDESPVDHKKIKHFSKSKEKVE